MSSNKIILAALIGIALGPLAGCATKPDRADKPALKLAPLKLFWDGRDNYTTATPQGECDALARGYKFCRVEGYVFTSRQSGTIPLKQYWSELRHDYWLLARDIPKNVEKNGAYQFVRVEGYVYTNAQPGTVGLKHFSLMRGDNFTFTSQPAEKAARTGGYGQRRLFNAFVIPDPGNFTGESGSNNVSGHAAAPATNGPVQIQK